jgi:peroxiredoxin
MSIEIGKPAPDFSLYDSDKNLVILSELKGQNVLLLFFPLAFTSVCTAELCSVRDNIGAYDKANATVLGISVDSTYVLAKFKEEQHYNFRLLSDFNKEASAAYDSLDEVWGTMAMKGVSKRSAFIVDKNGILKYAEILAHAGLVPDFGAIGKVLSELS